jgi:acetyltransferase
MIKKEGYEVIIGAKKDPIFGPSILFGMGGTEVEIFKDVAVGLPPLNQALAKRIIEETKVYELLKGYRNKPPADLKLLEEMLVRFSQMLVDFPQIKEVDINPLLIDEKEAVALDARIVIDKERVFEQTKPYEHLVISPYPTRYEDYYRLRNGREVLLRPIKPEDEPLLLEMFHDLTEETRRRRFFRAIGDTPHEVIVRYCNVDYDKEITIVAELPEEGRRKIVGIARLFTEADRKTGELALIVSDPWQGLGLGTKLIDNMIGICKEKNLETAYAETLSDNRRVIALMDKKGFTFKKLGDDAVKAILDLRA